MSNSKRTTGMVLGKFLPPHLGHQYLAEFAHNYVDDLTIVVGTLKNEPIPGELRFEWMKHMFPNDRVVHLTDENPQQPHEHPDFWNIWKESLERILPEKPDFVFASEDYGWKLAEILGAQFVPVDISRVSVPISGTEIRNNPMQNWEYIPREVRPYFAKKICVFGPESTGKSTLARNLSERFDTTLVPEYATTLINAFHDKGMEIGQADMLSIIKGHQASERALMKNANRILISDTDAVATTIWSKWLFNDCPSELLSMAAGNPSDLYLLTSPDVPWVDDQHRYIPEEGAQKREKGQKFFEDCKRALEERGLPYVVIEGNWAEREQKAIKAVEIF
ncbi:MAG: AAA family ATPase, partial [Bdellovibrionales bacterium]|nr:AAA family ATPase [Bdellovibrionales bacterium]